MLLLTCTNDKVLSNWKLKSYIVVGFIKYNIRDFFSSKKLSTPITYIMISLKIYHNSTTVGNDDVNTVFLVEWIHLLRRVNNKLC